MSPAEIKPELSGKSAPVVSRLDKLAQRLNASVDRVLPALKLEQFKVEVDFVKDSDAVAIQQEPLRGRILVFIAALVFFLFVLWAGITRIEEITRGDGKVIPSQQLQVLQSLDGGVVSEIDIREGQIVQKDQVLLKVDPTRFVSSVRENRSQYLSLIARAARLRALAEGKPFQVPPEVLKEDPKAVEEERRLYESANSAMNSQLAIARQQLAQKQQELVEAIARRAQASKSFDLTARELEVTKPLIGVGAVSEVELLRLERDVARFRGERDVASAQISRTQAAISEASQKINEVELTIRKDAGKELSDTVAKSSALSEGGVGLEDRVTRSSIRSPVRGTVKRLLVNTVGGVVQPGKDIVEIVPLEDNLLLEARVMPKDIAFLRPGQRAVVKFTAYDFSVYGGLVAKLEHIGADSVTDERGNVFFTVRVRTEKAELGAGLPIIPGMVAEVSIVTGKKSILSYLMKPVLKARDAALTER